MSRFIPLQKELISDVVTAIYDETNPVTKDEAINRTKTSYVGNLGWKMLLYKNNENIEYKLICNEQNVSTLWSCYARMVVKFVQQRGYPRVDRVFEEEKLFNVHLNWTEKVIMPYEEAINIDNNYILDGKLKVQARITILNSSGIRKRKLIDYTVPDSEYFDICFLIEDKRIYSNKSVLCLHSQYFNTMFSGNFTEKDMSEIALPEIKYDEFIDLLNVIFPTQTDIRIEKVQHLLELADRFEVDSALEKIENYLMASYDISIAHKLVFSQQFNLSNLLDVCLRSLNSLKDVTDLGNSEHYQDFDDDMKQCLIDRLMQFNEEPLEENTIKID